MPPKSQFSWDRLIRALRSGTHLVGNCHDCNSYGSIFTWWSDGLGEPIHVCRRCLSFRREFDSTPTKLGDYNNGKKKSRTTT